MMIIFTQSIFYWLRKILRMLLLFLGSILLIMVILSFTSLPFWADYHLGVSSDPLIDNPDVIIIMGGSGMPSQKGLIRCYYGAKAAHQFPDARVIIALPGDTLDMESSVKLMGKEMMDKGVDSTRIIYDLLDGQILHIKDAKEEDRPYIPDPFPKHPPVSKAIKSDASDEVKMRAHLLWAAIHLASRKDDSDSFHPVLISITVNPGHFAGTFIELLEKDWADQDLPCFFLEPVSPSDKKIYKGSSLSHFFATKRRNLNATTAG